MALHIEHLALQSQREGDVCNLVDAEPRQRVLQGHDALYRTFGRRGRNSQDIHRERCVPADDIGQSVRVGGLLHAAADHAHRDVGKMGMDNSSHAR